MSEAKSRKLAKWIFQMEEILFSDDHYVISTEWANQILDAYQYGYIPDLVAGIFALETPKRERMVKTYKGIEKFLRSILVVGTSKTHPGTNLFCDHFNQKIKEKGDENE